jgi:hypothetical protein
MRAVTIFLGLLIVISLAVWTSDAQDDPNPVGATEQPTVNSTVNDSEVDILTVGNLEVTEISPTAEPTDVPPVPITLIPTEMVFPTETALPDLGATASPLDNVPSITPSSTIQLVETQPAEVTVDATTLVNITATDTEMVEITPTSQLTPISLACELDVDTDGVVTDHDLSEIGRELLNSTVNETTLIYDLNENHQIDIGDLQKMVTYLLTSCPN